MFIKISHVLALLSATAALASASSFGSTPNDVASGFNDLHVRQNANCGTTNGACNANGCAGVNNPATGAGICTAGDFAGCPCANVCGATSGKCNENNCGGLNDPSGVGKCTIGQFAGCPCNSVCGTPGDCNKNGCEGVNQPGGQAGYCTKGQFAGCLCNSVCGDKDGSCSDNGCAGKGGVCTAGGLKGCSCDNQCGNLESKSCSANGCNGINLPDEGFGVCTGSFAGCACLLTCGATPGSCSKNGCNGSGGKCTAGAFNGCACV
ncbi:hypothetical protein BDV95DRAFT_642281 [Massariosphaeria phaeospora]|uniref:Uncharacterized protein n=1 Tax=Massariosphaeria phaeospora TaxID=100035 RepID=A0A7C8M4W5_9PLEO|nr:hypothetical protein BDV95DRAFT_642281 [Massariosphaeria phaeospora]